MEEITNCHKFCIDDLKQQNKNKMKHMIRSSKNKVKFVTPFFTEDHINVLLRSCHGL